MFRQPGYALTFVDMVRPLIDQLNAADGYTVWKATAEGISSVRITDYDALHIDDGGAIMQKMLGPNPIVSAAGARRRCWIPWRTCSPLTSAPAPIRRPTSRWIFCSASTR